MGKEVSYNEAVVDYLYNTEYSDAPKEKFLSALKNNKEVVDYLYNQHYKGSNYDDFLIAIGYQPVKKKEVLDSPSDSSQEVSPSPSKQVDAKDLIVPQAIQNQLNPQKEFNPEDFKLMVEQNKQQKLDKALEASKPVQAETSDVISQQVPVQSAEEMVAKDESIRDDEKLTANQLVKNKEKYETITKSLEDNIRDIPASELPNLYDAFDDKTKEFLDFQTRGEKDAFIDLLAQKREEVLDNQIKEYQTNELESFKPIDEGMTDELKQELALTKQKEENLSKGLSRIQEYTGLSGDDLVAFKQKVSEYNKLLESSRDGGTLTPEQKSKLNSLREDIKKVTDIEGDFYDPITGELSPEYTKEVLDTQEAIVGEYKNDYTKMSDRHAYLASKLRMLEKESVDMAVGNSTDPKLRERYLQDPMSPVRQYANYPSYNPEGQKRKAKAQEKLEEYKETMKEFDALNRALLLNEDPSKVERGFLSAMGESLYEGLIGEIVTDNDYRKNIVAQAQEAGIEINEEKAEELQDTFKEQLGETLGSSTAIGAEIAVTSFLTGGVAGALGAAGKSVPYLNRMYKVYQTNKKAAKVMDKAYDIIKSGVDFELASDETSFAMGAAEKSVGDLSEYLVKKLAGGKLGAFTKLFTKVGGRIVGGTAEEYGGDLADNLSEFGFTEQAIKETFGEGEEGLQKLYLIMAMSGGFGLPTEAVSFFKDKSAEIKAKRESGGTISESDAELESYIDQVIGEDNTIADTSDITPEKQEALKEAGVNLESEPTLEETEEVTEEVEPTVEEELTALAEKYKADPEAVKAELGITEEPTATEEVVVEDSPVVDQEVKTEEEVTTESVAPEKIEATTEEEVSVSEPEKVNINPKKPRSKSLSNLEEKIEKTKKEIRDYEDLISQSDANKAYHLTSLMNAAKKRLAKLEAKMPPKEELVKSELESIENNKKEQPKKDLINDESVKIKKEVSDNGKYWAKYYGGESFELEGEEDLGIVLGYNSYGDAIYSAYKGGSASNKSIENQNPTKTFTQEEIDKLKKLHNNLLYQEQIKSSQGSPFERANSDIIYSDNVSKSEKVLIESLKKAFGLDGVNIALFDSRDLNNESFDKLGFFGSFRSARINITKFLKGTIDGNVFKIDNGKYTITLNENLTPEQRFTVLSHEIGHILQFEKFDNAPKEIQNKVIEEYKNWLSKQSGKTEAEIVSEFSNIARLEDLLLKASESEVASLNYGFFKYFTSFKEYFAENVAKYVSSSEKPKSVLDKFFYSIYESLAKLYKRFKRQDPKFPEFKKWLDSVFDPEKAKSIIDSYTISESKGLGSKNEVDIFSETLQKQGIEKSVADKMATQFVENQNKKAQAKLDKKNLIAQAKESFKKALENQEREFASEAAFKVLERSELYNSLTKEEQAELTAQVEKFTSYKPKTEKSTEPKVETTKKQLLLDRIKNLKEGGDTLLKNVKDTKKELAKIIKGLQPDLTKEQYRQLVKVLQSTNTSEDLNSAILKIDNIAKYGKANPTTADIIQGEVKATEEFTEEQISELVYSEIERNNKQVKREDLKTIKELVKSLNLTSSALGKVSGAQVISLIKAMKKIDLSTTQGLAELRGRLEKQRSNNFQAKLKAAFKNSRTGNKGSLAERLINVDPNLINDYDTYNAVASALINSNRNKEYVIEGKTYSGAEIATKIEELEKQAEQNKADLEVAKAEVREKLLKEQYEKSSFSQGNPPLLTFDEYASLVDSQNTKAKEQASLDRLNKRLNALAERRDELKGLLKDSKQRLKDYISNDPNMSPETKRMLNSLVKFLSSDSNIENLVGDKGEVNKLTKDMLQAIEEVLAFNSTAAITSAAAVSNAINKSNELPKLGKIFRDKLIGIRLANKMASLDTAITFASKTVDQANEFIAQVLGDFKASSARARFKSVEFNKEIERLVSRARMSPEKSQLMGMVSFLTQENAKWYSFEEKKAIIEGQIKVLGENNENNKYVKSLEETYEQLKDFNSLEELNDALDGDTLFDQKEKDVLNYVRNRFKEIEPKLRESNYNNKGIDTESYTNYTPLYTHTLGDRGKLDTEAVLEDNMFTNKLDTKESSRTISRRKSTPGNVAYNFDFVESAKAGMYDAVYDIETLFDRKTLANLMKTQGYKDLFKTKQGDQFAGYALNLINERIKQYANAKTPSKPSDRMKSDISPAIRITQSILRNIIAYPLKNVGQIFKQTIPIATQVGTMLMNHPVKFLTSFKEVMTEDFLNSELYKSSASGTRLAGGEVAFDKVGSPVPWLLRKLYNPEGEGNKVSKAYEKNLSEVLTTSDNFINRVSLLAFYKAEAEKAGIPVDYNKPDPKVLAKAQAEASRINNVSDPAEMGELFAAQGKDAKDLKFLSQAFFMYKSFAVNAALNASINIRNLTTKPKATDLKRLAGALAGVIAFNMIGQAIRDQVKKVASAAIDRELLKEPKQTIPEYAIEQMSKGIFDLFTGILPNFSENSVKEAFNQVYAEGYEMATDEKLEKKPYYTEEGYNIMQLMLVTDYIDNTASIVQAISDSDSGLSDKEKAVLIVKFLGNVGFEGNIKMFTEGVSRDILKEYEKLKK